MTNKKNQAAFSIIIPVRNAGKYLPKLLEALSREKKTKEIIVIDSSSTDSTQDIASQFGAIVKTIPLKDFDHGGTRNYGASFASGEYLLFITQDILPYDNRLLEEIENVFKEPTIAGVYARQLPRVDANPVESLSRKFSYPEESRVNTYEDFENKGVKALYFANPCACVRRSVFTEVGGFPKKVICNEDMVMAHKILKAGYKTAYASKAMVYHSHDYSPVQLFKRYFDIGCFFQSYPELKSKAKKSEEGFSQSIKSLQMLIKEKKYFWIPKFCIETVVKLLGYKVGTMNKKIPGSLKKYISMNKNYWSA